MKVKISKYTFLFDMENNEFFIYNTLSNALVEIDKETYEYLQSVKKNRESIDRKKIDTELFDVLIKKLFLSENDKDDLLTYKSIIHSVRDQKEYMHLTIAPTMNCNFQCHYCFEKNKKEYYMTERTMDAIILYVKSIKELKHIHLTWFGGEPLMATKQMRQFYEKLRDLHDVIIDSEIITTGYHINREIVQLFKDLNITKAQITLDGNRSSHNNIKYTDDCDDVFSKVLDNIRLLLSEYPDIYVSFRINLTKQNASEYVGVFKLLVNMFQGKKIGVSPAFVMDRDNITRCQTCVDPYYFNHKESADFIWNLLHVHRIHSPLLRYPQRFIAECAIRDQRAISFDPMGYAYKCWEKIGCKSYAIGKIDKTGSISKLNIRM